MTYLFKYYIKSVFSAVKIGQDSRSRKARLRQLLSQICDKLNLQHQSIQHHNAAIAYASLVFLNFKDFLLLNFFLIIKQLLLSLNKEYIYVCKKKLEK